MPPTTRGLAKPYTVEDLRHELRAMEERWAMSTEVFLGRWNAGSLDESEFDFVRWEVAAAEFAEMARDGMSG